MKKQITEEYFHNYAGSGEYTHHYQKHSGIAMCLNLTKNLITEVRNVFVLGSATGMILNDFALNRITPWGVEYCKWAYDQTPEQHKHRVILGDMRKVVPYIRKYDKHFDLMFSNSLVYLEKEDIVPFLEECSYVCNYFHFYCSFKGNAAVDPWRVILEPYKWWAEQFLKAGFKRYSDNYLWVSTR